MLLAGSLRQRKEYHLIRLKNIHLVLTCPTERRDYNPVYSQVQGRTDKSR